MNRASPAMAASGDAILRKADLCAGALTEARRLLAMGTSGALVAQLLARAHELCDELEESLLALDHLRDRAVFGRMSGLRDELAELRSQREVNLPVPVPRAME